MHNEITLRLNAANKNLYSMMKYYSENFYLDKYISTTYTNIPVWDIV